MRLIPLSEIIIPADRQRQEFDPQEMQALTTSISTNGLLQPIVVRHSTEGPVLVAGERRIKAISELTKLGMMFTFEGEPVVWARPGITAIPCIDLGELTELQYREAEYDENDKRANLTWQEKAAATLRLARLRNAQAEAKGTTLPSVAEISQERRGTSAGSAHEATRRELIVAQQFENAEVAAAPTLDEAFKVLKRQEETQRRVRLAERVGTTFTADLHQLINTDCLDWLAGQPDGQFDVILTDPPYGMGADQFGDAGQAAREHDYDDSPQALTNLLDAGIFEKLYQVTKPLAHLYWMCDIDWFLYLRVCAGRVGWTVHRTPLIWFKPNGFRAPWPEHGPKRCYELILYARKGDKKVLNLLGDVIQAPTESGAGPANKPVALFTELLKRSAQPGDRVLDPFCGSGPIFPAAQSLKVTATGIELDAARYTKAMDRLNLLKGDTK